MIKSMLKQYWKLCNDNMLIYLGPFISKLRDAPLNALWAVLEHSKIVKFGKIKVAHTPPDDSNVIHTN